MKRYFSLILAIAATVSAQIVPSTGNVRGPTSATDNAVARYDGTTGKLIQNSGVTIDDSGNLTVSGAGTSSVAGNFGLGTTSPVSYSNFIYQTISGTNGSGLRLQNSGNTTASEIYQNSAGLGVFSISNLPIIFGANNSEGFRLFANGNLGVGTGSTDGGQKLQVSGTAALTSRLEINGATGANTTVTRITPSGWNELKHRYGVQSSGDTTQFSTNAAMTAAGTGNLDDTAVGAGVLNLSGASLQYAIATAGTNPRTFSSAFNVDYSGNATFAGTVTATQFKSATGSVSATNGNATTLFSLSGISNKLLMVHVYINVDDAANYAAYATIVMDGSAARIVSNNASLMTITLSGANVQATQNSGVTQSILWKYTSL